MATPDIFGFANAQDALRAQMGSPVTFLVPVDPVWPEGTKINPDTGDPYDPTIKPTSAAFTEVEKVGLIILKHASPLRPQADSESEPTGEMSTMDIIIDLATDDYTEIENASEMTVNGRTYRVREIKPFSLGSTIYRYLVYGAER